jgi:hypothetical protein
MDDGSTGWVFAPLVTISCDIGELPLVQPPDPAVVDGTAVEPGAYRSPMQVFTFRTGIGSLDTDEACRVPPSAIVVQSPQDTVVNFQANGVDVTLGSTMVLQSGEDTPLLAMVLEGAAEITAQTRTASVEMGAQGVVRLDAVGQPDSSPGVIPYNRDAMQPLAESQALQLLPDLVELPEPAVPGNMIPVFCDDLTVNKTLSGSEPVTLASIMYGGSPEHIDRYFASSELVVTLDGQVLNDFWDFGFIGDPATHIPIIEPTVLEVAGDTMLQTTAFVVFYPAGFLEPGSHWVELEFRVLQDFDSGVPGCGEAGETCWGRAGHVQTRTCTFVVQ